MGVHPKLPNAAKAVLLMRPCATAKWSQGFVFPREKNAHQRSVNANDAAIRPVQMKEISILWLAVWTLLTSLKDCDTK